MFSTHFIVHSISSRKLRVLEKNIKIFKFKKNTITTISQLLKKLGYYTCCDINNKVLMPQQGYDEYSVYDEQTVDISKRHSDLIKKLCILYKTKLFALDSEHFSIQNFFDKKIEWSFKKDSTKKLLSLS